MANKSSVYDYGGVLKNVHDAQGDALRTIDTVSVIKDSYTHLNVQYDGSNNPTHVDYLQGLEHQVTNIQFTADNSGSLNNKYFNLYAAPYNKRFYVWYNVGGLGVDPAIPNATGIEVVINTDETANFVQIATKLTVNNLVSNYFSAAGNDVASATMNITTADAGPCLASTDGNTGFVITTQKVGTDRVVETVDIDYTLGSDNPRWNGQVLNGYEFNIFTGKFEKLLTVTSSGTSEVFIKGTEDGTVSGIPHIAQIDSNLDLHTVDTQANLQLANIDAKLPDLGQQDSANSLSVVLSSDSPSLEVNLEAFTGVNPDNVQLVGSIDGTKAGAKYGFVNNIRQQILASHDREQDISYADFGTKNQRVTQIDYTSSTFPGIIARKTLTYTLVGNKYRRDSIDWTIV